MALPYAGAPQQNAGYFRSGVADGNPAEVLLFSRNIGEVTLEIIYFHYLEKKNSGSKHPKKHFI